MKNRTIIELFLTTALASGVALAASPVLAGDYGQKMGTHASLDTDGDGTISTAEQDAHVKAKFGKLDTDGDGKLTAAEIDAYPAAKSATATEKSRAHDKIMKMDTDGDGVLTSAEYAAGSRTKFSAMDANKDGKLTAAEANAAQMKESASTAQQ
jgi:hypothetical protein